MKTLLILLAVYFCSPTGNGSGTSYNDPCSFATGLTLINIPGDTLYLRGGQYNLGQTSISKNGSTRKNIVIASYPGEWAILDFRTTPYGTRGLRISNTSSYVHIKDMALCYSGKNNLYCEGSNCIFENLDIYGSADTGCQMKGSGGNNLILNCDSHDNFDYQNGTITNADFGGNADGFADKQWTGPGNTYRGCRSWNNSDDGWDFFQRVSSGSETVIENCICYQNGPASYDMRGHARYNTDKDWFDRVNGATITNRYGEQQVVSLENYPNHGNGNGFKLGGGYTKHNVIVHHCLALYNTVRGFDQNNNDGTMKLYNNIGYQNGINFGFSNNSYGTLYIRNNISFATRSADAASVKTVVANDHNSWQNGLAATAADFISTDQALAIAVRDAAGNLPVNGLFELSATSKYIDTGVFVGLPYNDLAPDMGWKETTGVPATLPTDTNEVEVYECKSGAIQIAYLTTPDAPADKKILDMLRAQDSLCIEIIDAAEVGIDYTPYELIVMSSVPSSASAGISPVKTVNKPRLNFKTFTYKSSVWNWGTPQNTADDQVTITDTTHPIFAGLSSPLKLFSRVSTNAVTTVSDWTVSPVTTLATASNGQDAIAEYSNTLTIGLSEYSTADLTNNALTLIDNAVWYMLGRQKPIASAVNEVIGKSKTKKYVSNGKLYIQINETNTCYTATGHKLYR